MSERKSGRARRTIVYDGQSNRMSMILALIVVAAIFIVVAVRSVSLRQQLSSYNEQIEALEEEIAEEEARTEQIEEYAKYVQTDEYVEEVARDKLGLVREGEVLFKNDGDTYSSSASSSDDDADEADSSASDTQTEESTEESDASSDTSGQDTSEADAASSETDSLWEPIDGE